MKIAGRAGCQVSTQRDDVEIQVAGEGDLPTLYALCEEVNLSRLPNRPTHDLAGIMKMPTGRVWIARSGAAAIGLIAAVFEGRRGWIWYFGVTPAFRKSGLGPRLLTLAEEFLKAVKAPKVLLMVRDSDRALLDYYGKHGYSVDDVTVMGKWLITPP